MFSLLELEEAVRKTVARYNRFRSPEAIARLVSVSLESVTIAFSGAFCSSCSVLGYIEGFIYDFKTLNSSVELKIDKTRQTGINSLEVDYKIKTR